jgi:hypothetical protein
MFGIGRYHWLDAVIWTGVMGVLLASGGIAAQASGLNDAVIGVFKRNKCDACHVPVERRAKDEQTGKLLYPAHRDFSYVLDLEKVKASKYVMAGAPERSPLYKLIAEEKMPEGAEFCFDPTCPYPPVSDDDKSIVETWIRSLK